MGITFEIPLFWILFFTASVLTLLIYLFFLEKSVAEERNRSLYSEGQLVEIIGYVNSLPDDQWQKHAVKRYMATKALERGTIKSITDVYPIKKELSIKQGQNTLLIGSAEQGKSSRIKEWIAKDNLQHASASNFDDLPKGGIVLDVLSFIGSQTTTGDEKTLDEVVKFKAYLQST